jgi:hypothetical protein
MSRLVLLAAVLAASVASTASAQRVYNLPSGQYVITGEVRAVGPVISPDGPVVPPPVVPPPVVPATLTKAVTDAVNAIPSSDKRNAAALKLSKVYGMMAGQKLPPAKAVEAVNTIVNLGLGADSKTLEGVYAVVNAALGKCTTDAAVSAVLSEAADAVGATVPASGDEHQTAEKYGIDWDKFMSFIMQLLTVLLPIILAL